MFTVDSAWLLIADQAPFKTPGLHTTRAGKKARSAKIQSQGSDVEVWRDVSDADPGGEYLHPQLEALLQLRNVNSQQLRSGVEKLFCMKNTLYIYILYI